jgi:Gram-negative bacterial TonB protein C-terminal
MVRIAAIPVFVYTFGMRTLSTNHFALAFRDAAMVLALTATAGVGFAQSQDAPAHPQTSSSAAASPVSIPSYPDNTKGLEHFVKDMLQLEMEGKQQEIEQYVKSLALPDPASWFRSVFGEDLGENMTRVSAPKRADAQVQTANMLAAQIAAKRTNIEVVRFDDGCNDRATATEYPFLLLRQKPEHLYDVRFLGNSGGVLWAYFAYVDGGFRFIGNMKATEVGVNKSSRSEDSTGRIFKGGNVQAARLIHKEDPVYPQEAKAAGLQGTVVLHAIIAKDGTIRSLELVDGVCALAQSINKGRQELALLPDHTGWRAGRGRYDDQRRLHAWSRTLTFGRRSSKQHRKGRRKFSENGFIIHFVVNSEAH